MTKTSEALDKQTKEILGETVVLGEGFNNTDAEAEAQAYLFSKRTGNQEDESFFDRVKDFFTPKPKEKKDDSMASMLEEVRQEIKDKPKEIVPNVKEKPMVDTNWYE